MSDVPRPVLDLTARRILVLGAGQGIGEETVRMLDAAGAEVLCVDRDADLAKMIAKQVNGIPLVADVTVPGDLDRVFAEATADGPLHGVVDIIGVARAGKLVDATDADLDFEIDLVTRHVLHTLRLAGDALADTGGSVAVVGSLSGESAIPAQGVYGAAKAAAHQLVRVAAVELAPRGIRVNAVAPFFVRTPRLLEAFPPDHWKAVAAATPNRRVAEPADIAGVLTFLLSDLALHVTGQIIPVDGGLSVTVPLPALPTLGW
ncbi:SDR family NAD(P)-dependent oxidoreductase [Rhodococcus koreensis]